MDDPQNFFSHVFNFQTDSRNEMVNIIQYTVIAILFITGLNRALQDYIPEVDKDKGSLVILGEISIECVLIFIGILFIHRIITFIPTLSGVKYADQNVITVILPTLIVLLTLSKLGSKVSIIMNRFNGEKTTPVSQPLLPKQGSTVNPINNPEPDFNTMFAGPPTPLVNAQTDFEPMASNYSGSMF